MLGSLAIGRTVERYRVVELLGEGGTAAVYRVRHVHLDTEHALKVMTLVGAQAGPRLLLEGRVQAALRHPNIVAVTDVLELDGSYGLLMEYVPPPALSKWLEGRGPLRPDIAEGLFRGIVEGVRHAHGHGLVHRDLKPANVLLARGDDGLVPKVADFGLARLLDEEGGHRHTRSGLAMGTPQYMAPEQFRDAKSVDRRADLFSLGCILHELLSGAPAFSWSDMIGVYTAMIERRWAPLPPGTPPHLAAAVEGCLAPDRDARIPDCGTLLAVLDGAARGPTLIPSPAERLALLDATAAPRVDREAPTAVDREAPTALDREAATVSTSASPTLAVAELLDSPTRTLAPSPLPPDPRPADGPGAAPDLRTAALTAPDAVTTLADPPARSAARPLALGALAVALAVAVAFAVWPTNTPGPPDATAADANPGPTAPPPATPTTEPATGNVAAVTAPATGDPPAAGAGAGAAALPPAAAAKAPTAAPSPTSARSAAAASRAAGPAGEPPTPATAAPAPTRVDPPPAPATAPAASAPAPSAPAAAPTLADVRASGANEVWLEGPGGRHVLPGKVPPGRYTIWAEFGAGPTDAGAVTLAAGDTVSIDCKPAFTTCPVRR